MRIIPKFISACVLISIILSLSISAFAVDVSPLGDVGWESEFRKFDVISQAKNGGAWNGYTCALQRFLGTYSDDLADVLDSSGNPDGLFGPKTGQAVEKYQQWKYLSVDRVVGPNTWGAIQWDLWDETNGSRTYFRKGNGGEYIMQAVAKTSGYDFYYYYYNGGNPTTQKFRSA